MRRVRKKNSKFYLTLILIASSTLLSFFFDQRVIQEENNIRSLNVEIGSERSEIKNLLFLTNYTLDLKRELRYSIGDLKFNLDKSYIMTDHLNYNIKEPEKRIIFKNSSENNILELRNNFSKKFKDIFLKYNLAVDKVKKYIKNLKQNRTVLNVISENKVYFKILNAGVKEQELTPKNFTFDTFISTDVVEDQKKFSEDNNYKIYSDTRDKMHYFSNSLDLELEDLHSRLSIIYDNKFIGFSNLLERFAKSKNNKKFLILLSIFFQILSLTFLMILFKQIINLNKK